MFSEIETRIQDENAYPSIISVEEDHRMSYKLNLDYEPVCETNIFNNNESDCVNSHEDFLKGNIF